MRAARVDATQAAIVEGLRAMGCSVDSLARCGNGVPDLLCGFKGHNVLLEVKVPGEKLNFLQKEWHREFKGTAHVVWSLSDAIDVMKHYGLKAHFPRQA